MLKYADFVPCQARTGIKSNSRNSRILPRDLRSLPGNCGLLQAAINLIDRSLWIELLLQSVSE